MVCPDCTLDCSALCSSTCENSCINACGGTCIKACYGTNSSTTFFTDKVLSVDLIEGASGTSIGENSITVDEINECDNTGISNSILYTPEFIEISDTAEEIPVEIIGYANVDSSCIDGNKISTSVENRTDASGTISYGKKIEKPANTDPVTCGIHDPENITAESSCELAVNFVCKFSDGYTMDLMDYLNIYKNYNVSTDITAGASIELSGKCNLTPTNRSTDGIRNLFGNSRIYSGGNIENETTNLNNKNNFRSSSININISGTRSTNSYCEISYQWYDIKETANGYIEYYQPVHQKNGYAIVTALVNLEVSDFTINNVAVPVKLVSNLSN